MKQSLRQTAGMFIAVMTAMIIFACASIGTTFNDRAEAIVSGVTLARTSATALMSAKTITIEQDKVIQGQLDLIIASVKAARAAQPTNPKAAEAGLTSAQEQLTSINKQGKASTP